MATRAFTVEQVAERLNIGASTVRKMISLGELPSIKIRRTTRVSEDDLANWLAALPREKGGRDGV